MKNVIQVLVIIQFLAMGMSGIEIFGNLNPYRIIEDQQTPNGVPDWTPVANQQYNMNVIGKIEHSSGIYSLDENDMIGAFCGEVCRGVGHPVASLGGIFFLTIGSNVFAGESITFQIYDASLDQVIDSKATLTFQSNSDLGTVTDPYILKSYEATPLLVVTPDSRTVGYGGSTTSLTVSNMGCGQMNWTAEVTQGDGFSHIISGQSGTNSGQIVVSIDPNPHISERQFDLTVTAIGAVGSPAVITITQAAAPPVASLSITWQTSTVGSEGESRTFEVSNSGTGQMNWSAEVTQGDSFSHIISGQSGTNSGQIVVSFDPNPENSERQFDLTVTAIGAIGSPTIITLFQSAARPVPVLSVTPLSGILGSGGGSLTFQVSNIGTGQMNWSAEVTQGESFAHLVSGQNGTDEGQIVIYIEPNPGSSERQVNVTVNAFEAIGSPEILAIYQSGQSIKQWEVSTGSYPKTFGYTTGDGFFEDNSWVIVSATPYAGFRFIGWYDQGRKVSDLRRYAFAIKSNCNLVAHFEESGTRSSFSLTYKSTTHQQQYNTITDVVNTIDNEGVLILGEYKNNETYRGVYLYKIDGSGTPIWAKEFMGPETVSCQIKSCFSDYFVSFFFDGEPAIMQISDEGVIKWTRMLPQHFSVTTFAINSSGCYCFGSFWNSLLIIKMDLSGSLLWSKSYSFPNFSNIWVDNATEDYDGNVILSGGTATSQDYKTRDAFLLKLNPNGDIAWARRIASRSNYQDEIKSMVIKPNSNILIGMITNDNLSNLSNGYLSELNPEGQVINTKMTPPKQYLFLADKADNNSHLLASWSSDFKTSVIELNDRIDITRIKTYDVQGYSLHSAGAGEYYLFGDEHAYNGNQVDARFGLIEDSFTRMNCKETSQKNLSLTNGNLVVSNLLGFRTTTSLDLININVPYRDVNLSTQDMCNNLSHGQIDELPDLQLVVYPNPANEIITLHSTNLSDGGYSIRLHSLLGTVVLEKQVEVTNGILNCSLTTQQLEKGMYILIISSADCKKQQKVLIENSGVSRND